MASNNSARSRARRPAADRFPKLHAELAALGCELIEEEGDHEKRFNVLDTAKRKLVCVASSIEDVDDWLELEQHDRRARNGDGKVDARFAELKARVEALGDHSLYKTDDGTLLVIRCHRDRDLHELVCIEGEGDDPLEDWLEQMEGGPLRRAAEEVLRLYRAPGWDALAGEKSDGGYVELGELDEALGQLEKALRAGGAQ